MYAQWWAVLYGTKAPLCRAEMRSIFVACSGAAVQGPGEAQRQRLRWGEEEQRNERAFALKAKRGI